MTLAYSRNAGAAEGSIMPAIITTHIAKSSARWPKSHVAVIIQAAEPVIEPYMSNAIGTIQAQHRAMAAARASPISQRSRRRRDSRGVRSLAGTRGRQRTTPCVPQWMRARWAWVPSNSSSICPGALAVPLTNSLSVNSNPVGSVTRIWWSAFVIGFRIDSALPSITPGTLTFAVRAFMSTVNSMGLKTVGRSFVTVVENTCQISFPGSVSRPCDTASRAARWPAFALSSTTDWKQARQPQLVLHHTVFDLCAFSQPVKIERRVERLRHRLLAVDVLARGDRLAHRGRAPAGGLRVEIDRVSGIGQRSIEIGGPRHAAALRGDGLQLGWIAAHQQRARHDRLAVAEDHPALLHDGVDGAAQVLVQSHAPGDAVHDDADCVLRAVAHACGPLAADWGHAPAGSGGASTPARGRVPSNSCRQCATSPAGP